MAALDGTGLDFAFGMRMKLPKITKRSGTLARPFCCWFDAISSPLAAN
jgi:hypothetical protein